MNNIFNSSQLVPWSKRRPGGTATKRGAKIPVEFVPNDDETAFEVSIKRLPASDIKRRLAKQRRQRHTSRLTTSGNSTL